MLDILLHSIPKGNIKRLVSEGLVSREDNYQALTNAIAGDILNQRLQRQWRREELAKLRATHEALQAKFRFLEERQNDYRLYLQACSDGSSRKPPAKPKAKGLFSFAKRGGKHASQKLGTVKYTGTKLADKGVLVALRDRTGGQPSPSPDARLLKQTGFELRSTAAGVFEVAVVHADGQGMAVQIALADLLQLQ